MLEEYILHDEIVKKSIKLLRKVLQNQSHKLLSPLSIYV